MTSHRAKHHYISPEKEVNIGIWVLFSGATIFLGLRLWCKIGRRNRLWYDDYILIASWILLLANDILISYEFATGYALGNWGDRMQILENISSTGTIVGQAWTKTAFAVTLLRMSNKWQRSVLWFCIITMNSYMILRSFFQWTKYCGKDGYQNWYRFQGPCINYEFENNFKEGGNSYNIILDFVFALFPWLIAWKLNMKRYEKIGLCITMSLGMLVAIISAVRTAWKSDPIQHNHDQWYMWRNGMSMIWYSAEVTGTIMVQCIPILRPFIREIHTSLTSLKLSSSRDRQSTVMGGKRASASVRYGDSKGPVESIALGYIREEPTQPQHTHSFLSSLSDVSQLEQPIHASDTGPLVSPVSPRSTYATSSPRRARSHNNNNQHNSCPSLGNEGDVDVERGRPSPQPTWPKPVGQGSRTTATTRSDPVRPLSAREGAEENNCHSIVWLDDTEAEANGLSPPPRRQGHP